MKENDLEIYDVWEAPTKNIFIKICDEYSIAIGCRGNHTPNIEWGALKTSQYIKANNITEVKKVGKLIFY